MQFLTEISTDWTDYELIDSGAGQRLEQWGKYTLMRPDPQAIWQPTLSTDVWNAADARFVRTAADRGIWNKNKPIPDIWNICFQQLQFKIRLTSFKHTGIFPEQSAQWQWMNNRIAQAKRPLTVLNLFGYTGAATLVCARAGAAVTHVDASKPGVTWARENQMLCGLQDKPIRWIVDDAVKFVTREIKRGKQYDAVIMDPPIYGHGPTGETWDLMKHLPLLVKSCAQLLTETPLFFLINSYAVSASAYMLGNVLQDSLRSRSGEVTVGELALRQSNAERILSTGIFARWEGIK